MTWQKMSMIWNIIVDFFEMVHIFIYKKKCDYHLKISIDFLKVNTFKNQHEVLCLLKRNSCFMSQHDFVLKLYNFYRRFLKIHP